MFKKKKASVIGANKEYFNMLEQIIRNYEEDDGFVDILDRFAQKEFANVATIPVCKTPNVLALGGANLDFDIVINPRTIVKCMGSQKERFHGHGLDKDIFKYLVFELRNPVMLLKGSKENSLVAVTDLKDREGRQIIVSVALNRKNAHHFVNQITSAYGRNNFDRYLHRQIELGNLLAINKNKANQMFQSVGLQLPIEETLISFDNSIAYSLDNVKGIYGNNLKNITETFPVVFSGISNKENDELNQLINRFNDILFDGTVIIEKLQFFEYAKDEIYNSVLWQMFLKDKEFLLENDSVVKLKETLVSAQKIVDTINLNVTYKEENKDFDL